MNEAIKKTVHFSAEGLVNSVHPITVNLIGVGGTGNHVLSSLADIHETLLLLEHPGLMVRAFDEDNVSIYNMGRQRFARSEIGLPKAAALINRINRFYGTAWKAILCPFSSRHLAEIKSELSADITVSCVDTVESRFDIEAVLLKTVEREIDHYRSQSYYWMDFGNTRYTGQVVLSTLRPIRQPASKKFQAVASLPLFTQEYRQELELRRGNQQPSCSMHEAITRQDLFINPILAKWGMRLLWSLLSDRFIRYRGVFVNAETFKTVPIPIDIPAGASSIGAAA